MLGRAVQLTFPHHTPREEYIGDSTTAERYLEMALHARLPSHLLRKSAVDAMRQANVDGSYLWGDYPTKFELRPPPDVRLLNLETAVTVSIDNPDVPLAKGIHYHLHALNLSLAFCKFASTTFQCIDLQHDDGAKEDLSTKSLRDLHGKQPRNGFRSEGHGTGDAASIGYSSWRWIRCRH